MGMAGGARPHRRARCRDDRARPRQPCGKDYLREQAQIVENWVGFVERHVERGVGPDEILKEGVPVTRQDPYPIGQRLFIHDERLTGLIVNNLHARILARKSAAAG